MSSGRLPREASLVLLNTNPLRGAIPVKFLLDQATALGTVRCTALGYDYL